MARRSFQLYLPFLFLLFIVLLILQSFAFFQPNRVTEAPQENFDVFVYSSYFFPESKSLGDNAIAVVFTADFELGANSLYESRRPIVLPLIGLTNAYRITPHQKCKWIDYHVVLKGLPLTENVSISTGDKLVEIPFSTPSTNYHDVVTCVAPLYASEQWQLLILAAHIYRRFGSHMHLYVRSMVDPLYDLMKNYEKEGYLTIQPWHRVHLSDVPLEDLNPNLNVEFRNQAAAQTDCLLQYKEKASFISFVDLDDILIPRLGLTYFDEFNEIFNAFPNSAYLFYGKENTRATTSSTSAGFSISETISSVEFEQQTEMGKFVTQPKYINASWIHWPPAVPRGMRKHYVPSSINAITHLKHLNSLSYKRQGPLELPLYKPDKDREFEPKELLAAGDLQAIEGDYQKMMSIPRVKKLMPKMPEEFFYSKLIGDCYGEFYKFYYSGQLNRIKCFGPERCQFPRSPGIFCYNALGSYESHDGVTHNVHFARTTHFHREDGCIR